MYQAAPHYPMVYPRWRGEHVMVPVLALAYTGLYPLARGTLPLPRVPPRDIRFIPADAGNTFDVKSYQYNSSVYPR